MGKQLSFFKGYSRTTRTLNIAKYPIRAPIIVIRVASTYALISRFNLFLNITSFILLYATVPLAQVYNVKAP